MAAEKKISVELEGKMDSLSSTLQRAEAETEKHTRAMSTSFNRLESGVMSVGTSLGVLAAGASAVSLGALTKDATLASARFETLGVVMTVVGKNAGYTTAQIASYAEGVARMGISNESARSTVIKMASAHIDLEKSQQLARIAQDAAVIGNLNSSEAFEKMIHGIQTGQTDVLRMIGINVNFEDSYKKIAAQLKKSKEDLSETEKMQARTNVVMEKGKDIAGAYEASMSTMGKQLTSVKRYHDDLGIAIGDAFRPAAAEGVSLYTEAVRKLLKLMQDNKDTISQWGQSGGDLAHGFGVALKGFNPWADHKESGGWRNFLPLFGDYYYKSKGQLAYDAEQREIEKYRQGPKSLEDERDNYAATELVKSVRGKEQGPKKEKKEKKNYTEDAPGFMNWKRTQEDEKEELSWLTERNKELEKAQAELQKIMDEMDLDEINNGLKKSDAWLNYMGELSDTQQAAFDETSMRKKWEAEKLRSDQAAQMEGERVMSGAGMGESPEMLRIRQEEEAAIQSWAMQTDSFEEYERRKIIILKRSTAERLAVEKRHADVVSSMQYSAFQSGVGLLNMFAGKSKAAAIAALVLQKGLSMAEVFVMSKAAAARALAELGPIVGTPIAASIETWGYVNMGLIAATGIAEGAMSGSGGGGGGGGGYGGGSTDVSPSNQMVTQPPQPTTRDQGAVTIVFKGNVMDQQYIEETVIPMISDAGTRQVRIEYL